jgi:Ubiquitin elongating factor core
MSDSGFLPDLARWALGGGAAAAAADASNEEEDDPMEVEDDDDNQQQQPNPSPAAVTPVRQDDTAEHPLSAAELRAQRLARISMMTTTAAPPPATTNNNNNNKSVPMVSKAPPVAVAPTSDSTSEDARKKFKSVATTTTLSPAKKLQRKKELLLRKVLHVQVVWGNAMATTTSLSIVPIQLDGPNDDEDADLLTLASIAEILAMRLSLEPDAGLPPLISYLADSFRRAADELKSNDDHMDLLQEIQRQVTSYAVSCVLEPELFAQGHDATTQLADALLAHTADPLHAITFGVSGPTSSFYYQFCQELVQQQHDAVPRVVQPVVDRILDLLLQCNSVLDTVTVGGETVTPTMLVQTLTALCSHKAVAQALCELPQFLLPAADEQKAARLVRAPQPSRRNASAAAAPPPPPGRNATTEQFLSWMMETAAFQQNSTSNLTFAARSGPALEYCTLLGRALRLGVPLKYNAALPPNTILRQSVATVERINTTQRLQLKLHQDACFALVMAAIKAGGVARAHVLTWLHDLLLVNTGASAMRPDPTKVSGTGLLLNTQQVLLRLCQPFLTDASKQHLIDPCYLADPTAHGGVYATTGDAAVPRLGDSDATTPGAYQPKNTFIPTCFFLTARAVHYGIVPLLSAHETVLRQISHLHWDISNNAARSVYTDPHFGMLVARQRCMEVALYQEELVADSLQFVNCLAQFIVTCSDQHLAMVPEDFVSDACDVVTAISKFKSKLLTGVNLSNVFHMVVKLLSPQYATVSAKRQFWCSLQSQADFLL